MSQNLLPHTTGSSASFLGTNLYHAAVTLQPLPLVVEYGTEIAEGQERRILPFTQEEYVIIYAHRCRQLLREVCLPCDNAC